jgi:hypothetical protein
MRIAGIAASMLILVGLVAAVPASGKPRRGLPPFKVTGSVEGLLPGVPGFIPVKVRNPYRRPMTLVSVTARVRNANERCTRWNLEVRPFRGRLRIPRGRTRVARLRVRMPLTAAPECRGAKFPLDFRARAVVR